MFLFHHVRPLTKQEEAQVIYDMVKTIQWNESLHFTRSSSSFCSGCLDLCWDEGTDLMSLWHPRSKSGHDAIQ